MFENVAVVEAIETTIFRGFNPKIVFRQNFSFFLFLITKIIYLTFLILKRFKIKKIINFVKRQFAKNPDNEPGLKPHSDSKELHQFPPDLSGGRLKTQLEWVKTTYQFKRNSINSLQIWKRIFEVFLNFYRLLHRSQD